MDTKQAGDFSHWTSVLFDELASVADLFGVQGWVRSETHPARLGGHTSRAGALHDQRALKICHASDRLPMLSVRFFPFSVTTPIKSGSSASSRQGPNL